MSDYTLNIIVNGVDQTGPAQQGMDRLGVGGIAAGNLIAGALQSAAGAVTGFVGSAVSAAGDFQQNLNVLQAASGATSAQMDQMRQMAVALGNDMTLPGASASDAATAMLELSKAGLSVTDTMDAAKGTLQLAAAAETDAATAAQVVSGALNAFGLSGEHATEIADQLAAGANASAASMTDLSDGFKQAGFAFNATGQSTADLISGLAMLTNVGLTGSDAGTALKNAMLQLMAPTDAAAKTMAQYGINVRDAQGNMLPFRDIIGVLQTQLGGLSAAQREAALKTILQGDGMKAMLPLLDAGVAGFDAMKAKVMVAGAAEEMAAAKMEGFKGAMGGLSNAVDTLKLAIGTALLPVLTFLINTIASPAINAVTNFIMALQGNADAIGQMSAPMQMLMGFLGSVWAASAQVVEAFNSAGTYSLQFALALGQLGMAFGLPAELLPEIVFSIQSFVDAIYPALDAIGAVVEAFNSAGTYSLQFALALGQLGMAFGLPAELLPEIVFSIQSFVDAIYPALDAIGAFVIGTGDLGTVADFLIDLLGVTLGGILTDAIGVLMSYAQVWIDLGATIFNVASALMSGDLAGAWAALTSGLAQVVADYQFYAQSMGALVLEIVNAIVTAVITYAPMIYAQLLTWGQAFVDWITPYIPIALTYLQSYAASIWAWIVEQAPILYQQVLTWGQAFVDWITPYISIALTALGGFIASIWAWIVEQAPILYQQVLTWGQAFVDWITPYISIALTALGGFIASIWAWIVEQAPILYQQVLTWGQAFVDWITPYISLALTALGGFISAVWAWIVEQAPGILDKVMAWGQSLVEWVAPQIPVVLGALGEMASSFFDWISEQAGPILEKLGVWAAALVEWIVPATVDFLAAWPGMLSSFLDWIANAVGPIAAGLVDWALEMVAWVAPMIPDLLVAIAGIAAALLTFIAETAIVLVPKVIAWAGAFLDWVATDVLPKIAGVLGDILTRIEEWIGTAVDWIVDEAVSLGQAMIDGAVKGIEDAGSALLDTMSNMANDALNAAKKALGIASPSKVMAQEVGAPIVDGIVAGLVQRSPKAVQAMLDLASSMFDVVSKGVEAFGKLTQLGTIPQSAIANFGDAIMRTLTEFSARVGQWDKAAMSAASQFTFKAGQVVDFLAKGVELLNGIAALAVPSQDAIRAFADALAMVMSEIVRVSTFELRLGLTAGVEFASGAKAIAEMIGAGVEALNKLSDFVRPAPGVIQTFVDVLGWLVSRIVLVAQWFDGQALGAAAAFAGATKQIMEVVGAGVDGLLKLGEFVKPAPGVIQTFADTLGWLVSRFVTVGGWFSGPALAAAGAFADSAGKVVGVIAAGVDGLLKLGEFVRPAPGAIQEFTTVIWWLVSRFAEAAGWMTGRALAEAVRFADGAGKVVGIIGAAVDALGKLVTFVAPAEANVSAFLRSMADLLEKMGSMAYYFEQDMLEATAALAEGISKSVAGIGAGVDLLSKLVNFVAPAEANVSAFLRGMADLLEKMGSMAYYFEQDMLEATGALAAGIAKSVAGLGAAVDVLGKLVTFVAPAEANVSAFLRGLADLLEKMGSMAYYFEQDMLAVTGALAEGIGKSVAGLGTAVDALSKLVDFVAPAEANVSAFFRSLADLLEKMGVWSANFEADMLEATGAFAAGIQKSVAGIGAAADALGKLVDFVAPAEKNVSAFFRSLADLLEKMGVWSANFEADMLASTATFASGVNAAVAPLKGAIESLAKFSDFVPPAQKGVSAFFQSIGQLLTQMGTLAGQYSAEFFAGTITFGQNIAKAVETIKTAFGLIAGLAGLKGVAAGVLTKFIETLAAMLAELERQVAPASFNVGQYLALGIAAGITSGTPAIVNAVYAAINQAILAAKAALGIASPSKVFQQQIGLQMAAGMAGGMTMGAPLVDRAVTDVSGRAVASAAAAGGGGGGSTLNVGGLTIVQQPGQNAQQLAQTVIAEIERRSKRKL